MDKAQDIIRRESWLVRALIWYLKGIPLSH